MSRASMMGCNAENSIGGNCRRLIMNCRVKPGNDDRKSVQDNQI
jgi:hypothetical protein